MTKLDELRAAALAGKNIADYDHAALARYVTALNPVTVLAMIDAIEKGKAVYDDDGHGREEWEPFRKALVALGFPDDYADDSE
jgi:hypothetical protein